MTEAIASYTIRQFHEADLEGYLRLFEAVFDTRDPAWFRWKYGDNPYVDHSPIAVAEVDGELVGARSLFAIELAHGDSTSLALQPCDTMVHPDHRRRGLMTRMTEQVIDTYRGTGRFFYNTPNQQALSVNRTLGWRIVDRPPTYFRIESLDARVPASLKPIIERAVGTLLPPTTDRERGPAPAPEVDVACHEDMPIEALTSLYRRSVTEPFHAVRDEQFYRWRFSNPRWRYRTYLAVREGEVVASIVAGTQTANGETVTRLVDILPLEPDPSRYAAIAAVIQTIIDDHDATDIFALLAPGLPAQLLADRGFVPDTAFPLSHACQGLTLVSRPLTGSWNVDGLRIDAPGAWLFSFTERDTS